MSPASPARTVLLVLLLALAATCSEDKSFVVVSVFSSVHPIDNVAQLRVKVTDGSTPSNFSIPTSRGRRRLSCSSTTPSLSPSR